MRDYTTFTSDGDPQTAKAGFLERQQDWKLKNGRGFELPGCEPTHKRRQYPLIGEELGNEVTISERPVL